ncbi:MAG: diadenylate cyclase CdaA [Fimbriimonadaceae bacterium]
MEDFLRHLNGLTEPTWRTFVQVLDILLVAFLVYRLLLILRGSRAWLVVGGIVVFFLLLYISEKAQLTTLNWILDKATLLLPVALVILLLPELRQALEGVGKNPVWTHLIPISETHAEAQVVEEIVAAVTEMAASNVGALIVVERAGQLDDIVSNGVLLEAKLTAPLLGSIFYEGNPLHDGAVVVRGDRILAAACRLPLSEGKLSPNMHMRHHAALGITEQRDCICIVVSEERGSISVALDGHLEKLASHQDLRDVLNRELRGVGKKVSSNGIARRLRRARESRRKNRTP